MFDREFCDGTNGRVRRDSLSRVFIDTSTFLSLAECRAAWVDINFLLFVSMPTPAVVSQGSLR